VRLIRDIKRCEKGILKANTLEAKKIKIKTLIICLAAICFVEAANWLVTSRHLWDPMIGLGTARLLETILILLIVLLWGKGLTSIGLASSKIFPGIIKGLTWSFGFGVVALLGFFILSMYGHDPLQLIKTSLPRRQTDILIFFLVGGIVAPVAEEVFFRGILYGFFKRWGVVVAIVLSTALFVLPHLRGHGLPITQIVGGVLFAIAYEVEGSLMTPITIHALANLTIFSISLMT
jgi:membrane protease YdiL (CAAX protease family)